MLDRMRRAVEVLFGASGVVRADPEDLFDVATGYVTLGAEGYESLDRAGLCFNRVESVGFDAAIEDVEDLLAVSSVETDVVPELIVDDYGYGWVVVEGSPFEDLVTAVHMAADTLIEEGFENYLLCAVFAFEGRREAYWIYNFKRGTWYPFVPVREGVRDRDLEDDLRDLVGSEFDLETDESRQYSLWGIPF